MNAGNPMPALVSSMPMLTYDVVAACFYLALQKLQQLVFTGNRES
jgi:hypothetical protein